jgi:hypothetical protein
VFLGRYDFSLPDTFMNGGLRPLRNPIPHGTFEQRNAGFLFLSAAQAATGGAAVVYLADPSVGPGAIAARAFVMIEEHRKISRRAFHKCGRPGSG